MKRQRAAVLFFASLLQRLDTISKLPSPLIVNKQLILQIQFGSILTTNGQIVFVFILFHKYTNEWHKSLCLVFLCLVSLLTLTRGYVKFIKRANGEFLSSFGVGYCWHLNTPEYYFILFKEPSSVNEAGFTGILIHFIRPGTNHVMISWALFSWFLDWCIFLWHVSQLVKIATAKLFVHICFGKKVSYLVSILLKFNINNKNTENQAVRDRTGFLRRWWFLMDIFLESKLEKLTCMQTKYQCTRVNQIEPHKSNKVDFISFLNQVSAVKCLNKPQTIILLTDPHYKYIAKLQCPAKKKGHAL